MPAWTPPGSSRRSTWGRRLEGRCGRAGSGDQIATTTPVALEDAHGWVLTPCSDEDGADRPHHFWVYACVNEWGERVSRKDWDAADGTVLATEAEVQAALATGA